MFQEGVDVDPRTFRRQNFGGFQPLQRLLCLLSRWSLFQITIYRFSPRAVRILRVRETVLHQRIEPYHQIGLIL